MAVIEKCAMVSRCYAATPRELNSAKRGLAGGVDAGRGLARGLDHARSLPPRRCARSAGVACAVRFEVAVARCDTAAGSASGSRSGIGLGQARDRDGLLHHSADAHRRSRRLVVARAVRPSITGAHRKMRAALGHVLMNGVVGEAGERLRPRRR